MSDETNDIQNIKYETFFVLFRSVTQSTITHTGIGILRNGTKQTLKGVRYINEKE